MGESAADRKASASVTNHGMVRDRIHDAGFFVDVDTTDRTINKKVREAQMAQYNYILVVGEKEVGTGQIQSASSNDELLCGYEMETDAKLKSIDDLLNDFKDDVATFR